MSKEVSKEQKEKEEAEFKRFLKDQCPMCGVKALKKTGHLQADCGNCPATFMYGREAVEEVMEKNRKAMEDKAKKEKSRREFVDKASNDFLEQVPASDIAIDVCVSVIAKMMHMKDKELSANDVQAKVNDIADMIGTEAFRIFHSKKAKS